MSDDDWTDFDHSAAPISWEGSPPSTEIIAKVRDSIRDELFGLEKPEDLMFHTVFLDDNDFRGATVCVFGGEAGGFSAIYTEKTEWAPITDAEA